MVLFVGLMFSIKSDDLAKYDLPLNLSSRVYDFVSSFFVECDLPMPPPLHYDI